MVIKHVYGNVLNIEIPLTVKIVTLEDGETSEREEPFYPDMAQPVKVKLNNKYSTGLTYDAEVTGNVLHISDKGNIRTGKYNVTVTCMGQDGNPYRYMCKDAIEVVNATADAGIEAGVEFDVETYTLEGAVFIDYTSGEQVQSDWAESNPDSKAYIKNKPDLSDFATQGDLAEVEGKIPVLPENIVTDEEYVHTDNNYSDEDKAKVGNALTQETDPTVPNWAKQPSKPTYTAREVGALPSDTPLFSGSYNDLTDKPTIPDAQIQSDWNQTNTGAKDFIKNKPAIPTVPTNVSAFVNDAGYVNDISMKVDKEQGKGLSSNDYTMEEKTKLAGLENYDDTAVRGLIAGKQDIINDLATIRSGAGLGATAYQKPSTGIPSSDMNAAVQTSLGKADTALQSQVNSDWDAVSGPAAILNKPSIPTKMSDVASISVVAISTDTQSSCSIIGSDNSGKCQTIIYMNNSGSDLVVTVPTTYATPDGAQITVTVKSGGYCEVNYLNMNGTIYARAL